MATLSVNSNSNLLSVKFTFAWYLENGDLDDVKTVYNGGTLPNGYQLIQVDIELKDGYLLAGDPYLKINLDSGGYRTVGLNKCSSSSVSNNTYSYKFDKNNAAYRVSDAHSVVEIDISPKLRCILINKDDGSEITVERLSSEHADGYTGLLENNDVIFDGDKLHITIKAKAGKKIIEAYVENNSYHDDCEAIVTDTDIDTTIISKGIVAVGARTEYKQHVLLFDCGIGIKSIKASFIWYDDNYNEFVEGYKYHGDHIIVSKYWLKTIEIEFESGYSHYNLISLQCLTTKDGNQNSLDLLLEANSETVEDNCLIYNFLWNGSIDMVLGSSEDDTNIIISAQTSLYKIKIEQGENTSIIVKRVLSNGNDYGEPLKDGDIIRRYTRLHVTIKPVNGYGLVKSYVYHNSEVVIDTNTEVDLMIDSVRGPITVGAVASELSPYTLTINVNADTAITVERVESPLAGAATCELIDGDNIYYGDILTITIQGLYHTILPSITYNGLEDSDHISPVDTSTLKIVGKKVTGNAEIYLGAAVPSFLIGIVKDETHNVSPRIKRIKSILGADLVEISDNNDAVPIYAGDTLQDTTVFQSEEYELKGLKISRAFGGIDFEIPKGGTYTVPDIKLNGVSFVDLIIKKRDGLVSIDNGTSFEKYMIYIDNGTSWDRYLPYIDNGTSWDLYN